MARILRADRVMLGSYRSHLDLLALTYPLVRSAPLSANLSAIEEGQEPALFPASESPEGRLVKRLSGNRPVPPGFDVIGELISRVQGCSDRC